MKGIIFDSVEEAKVASNKARENREIIKSKGGELREKITRLSPSRTK